MHFFLNNLVNPIVGFEIIFWLCALFWQQRRNYCTYQYWFHEKELLYLSILWYCLLNRRRYSSASPRFYDHQSIDISIKFGHFNMHFYNYENFKNFFLLMCDAFERSFHTFQSMKMIQPVKCLKHLFPMLRYCHELMTVVALISDAQLTSHENINFWKYFTSFNHAALGLIYLKSGKLPKK